MSRGRVERAPGPLSTRQSNTGSQEDHMAAKSHEFTATHGVALDDLGVAFTFDAERTGNRQDKVYSLVTSDAKVADALRKIDDYGIAEAEPIDKSDDAADES